MNSLHLTTKIFVNGFKVGTVKGDTFYKKIRGSIHIMRNPHAIFFDIESLREVESLGAKFLHITDKETGEVYTASIAEVWQFGINKNYTTPQIGLAVNRFNTKQGQVSPTISFTEYFKRHPAKAEKQLSLFGGG